MSFPNHRNGRPPLAGKERPSDDLYAQVVSKSIGYSYNHAQLEALRMGYQLIRSQPTQEDARRVWEKQFGNLIGISFKTVTRHWHKIPREWDFQTTSNGTLAPFYKKKLYIPPEQVLRAVDIAITELRRQGHSLDMIGQAHALILEELDKQNMSYPKKFVEFALSARKCKEALSNPTETVPVTPTPARPAPSATESSTKKTPRQAISNMSTKERELLLETLKESASKAYENRAASLANQRYLADKLADMDKNSSKVLDDSNKNLARVLDLYTGIEDDVQPVKLDFENVPMDVDFENQENGNAPTNKAAPVFYDIPNPTVQVSNKRAHVNPSTFGATTTKTCSTPASKPNWSGIPNFGNSCFVNATLQCLKTAVEMCPQLYQGISHSAQNGNELSGLLLMVLDALLYQVDPPCVDKALMLHFKEHVVDTIQGAQFAGNTQQDAQEFLSALIDSVREADVNRPFFAAFKHQEKPAMHNAEYDQIAAANQEMDVNLVCQVPIATLSTNAFQLVTMGHAKCAVCGTQTETSSVDSVLPLAFNAKEEPCIRELVEDYFKPVDLLEENAKLCEPCKTKQNAKVWKQVQIAPMFLILQLMRFDSFGRKDSRLVTLDDELFGIYDLVGFVSHDGSTMSSGHYFATAKRGQVWYKFDDENVTEFPRFDNTSVRSTKAYLVFYKKREEVPATPSAANDNSNDKKRKL